MFGWGKKRKSPAQLKQRRVIILRDTLTLVRVANKVESEEAHTGSLKSTTARDLANSRLVRNAQRVLTEHILRGVESGLSLEDITSEVIGPVMDESELGDVARFAIDQAVRGAGRKHSHR